MLLRAPAALPLALLALVALLAMQALAPAVAFAQSSQPPAASSPGPTDGEAVVRAVLFFSPTCPHCELVINDILPVIFAENGGDPGLRPDAVAPADDVSFYLLSNPSLEILLVDVSRQVGARMLEEDSIRLGLDRAGVPRLDVADGMLVGSAEIPDLFPGIIVAGLSGDGVDWPAVPGLSAALAGFVATGATGATGPGPQASVSPASASPAAVAALAGQGFLEKVGRDPLGNGIAVLVLLALVVSLVAVPMLAARGSLREAPAALIPMLAGLGFLVAAYLAFIALSDGAPVCGPVGDCGAVQASEYALVFGLPVGVLGLGGYGAILALWGMARAGSGRLAEWADVGTAAIAYGGVLFSAYLTFLEPFVIGATCLWCVSSALLMLALLWSSAGPAWSALHRPRGPRPPTSRRAGHDAGTPAASPR